MAFSGERSSWLILARNSLFSRSARSTSCGCAGSRGSLLVTASSSAVVCRTCAFSVRTASWAAFALRDVPIDFKDARRGVAVPGSRAPKRAGFRRRCGFRPGADASSSPSQRPALRQCEFYIEFRQGNRETGYRTGCCDILPGWLRRRTSHRSPARLRSSTECVLALFAHNDGVVRQFDELSLTVRSASSERLRSVMSRTTHMTCAPSLESRGLRVMSTGNFASIHAPRPEIEPGTHPSCRVAGCA